MPARETVFHGHDPLTVALDRCRQLEDRIRQLSAIVESSDEAILAADTRRQIVFWSPGAEHLLGYRLSDVEGRPMTVIFADQNSDELSSLAEQVHRGKPLREFKTKAERKNGVVLDVSLSMSTIEDESGTVNGLCLVVRDITEQCWMADTLNKTLKSLETALEETRASEERCRRFTADAAHQIRTPLAGIRACAETLLLRPSAQEQDALLGDVVRETARAGRLMTALLQMARLDQGQTVRPAPCDVVQLCSAELERLRPIAPHLDLEITVLGPPPARPELDRYAVGEILANLLDNASRYAARRIEVIITTREANVEIRVADDGPGVPPAMESQVFDRFVTVDSAGSGLGLPIAKALAQAHGGDLSYESQAFLLRLPVKSTIECGGAGAPDFAGTGAPGAVDWESWAAP